MKRWIQVYLQGAKANLAGRMAYRGDFVLSTVLMLIVELLTPLITFLIYKSGASFPGWSFYEAMLIQSIFLLSKGVSNVLFGGIIGQVLVRVREGTFDIILTRPRPSLFMIIATSFDMDDVGKLIGGITLFSLALSGIPSVGLPQWLQFILLFIISLTVFFAFTVFMSATVIKWVGNSRIFEIFDCISSFGLYPATIFSKSVRTFITIIIPIAAIGFFPASALLGRTGWMMLWTSIVSIAFALLSLKFWNYMLAKYTGAGG